jgi:FkbM family methyltransferase
MKILIQKILKNQGFQIMKYPSKDLTRRIKIIKNLNIDTIFDIGANAGQYASRIREAGYSNRIISFEPVTYAFKELLKNSSKDENWHAEDYAIGDEDTTSIINIAGNSFSSSILEMLPSHEQGAPESKYVDKQEITIKKIDSIFGDFCNENSKVMMKIDTQGFEKNVLDGAINSLSRIDIIQLEMSIEPLYEKEMLFIGMIKFIESKGFKLFSLENGFSNPSTGQLLQVDGVFVNKTAL